MKAGQLPGSCLPGFCKQLPGFRRPGGGVNFGVPVQHKVEYTKEQLSSPRKATSFLMTKQKKRGGSGMVR